MANAAEAGHTSAMANLGALLYRQDEQAEAERWWRTAADAGNTGAMDGLRHLMGDGGAMATRPAPKRDTA